MRARRAGRIGVRCVDEDIAFIHQRELAHAGDGALRIADRPGRIGRRLVHAGRNDDRIDARVVVVEREAVVSAVCVG